MENLMNLAERTTPQKADSIGGVVAVATPYLHEHDAVAADIVENQPNPARTVESLRQLGYENYAAICDLVDNSFDAGAQRIWIGVNRNAGDFIISVVDDGSGMDRGTLDQALRLGSLTQRDEGVDLGKFGMGLVTASLSIARRTTAYTRTAGGEVWMSQTDIDQIIEQDRFLKVLRPATASEVERFASYFLEGQLPEHGTAVILDHCDNVGNTNTSAFKDALRNRLAETYRYFIGSGRQVFLQGEAVQAFDPLMLEDPQTEGYSDDSYDLALKDAEGRVETQQIRIRIAVLPEMSEAMERYRKINQANQGFYVVRNWRQIAAGQTLGVFEKHNEYNRIRIELFFSGALDQQMGVRFTKQGVEPIQAVRDRIREAVRGQITTLGERIKKERRASTPDRATEAHDEAAKVIASKSQLLIKPQAEVEQREPRRLHEESETIPRREPKSPQERRDRKQLKRTALATRDLNCRFERVSLGRLGPIFEAYLEGKTVVVAWNEDHPFYDTFVLKNADDKDVVGGIDFFAYSLASAMLKTKNDENVDILDNIMTIVSTNMRVLLT